MIMMTYVFMVNIISFILFRLDSELEFRKVTMLSIAFAGGSIGALIAIIMPGLTKKSHLYSAVIPVIILMQILGVIMYFNLPWVE